MQESAVEITQEKSAYHVSKRIFPMISVGRPASVVIVIVVIFFFHIIIIVYIFPFRLCTFIRYDWLWGFSSPIVVMAAVTIHVDTLGRCVKCIVGRIPSNVRDTVIPRSQLIYDAACPDIPQLDLFSSVGTSEYSYQQQEIPSVDKTKWYQ